MWRFLKKNEWFFHISKNDKVLKNYNCLFRKKCLKRSDSNVICSVVHELKLQVVRKSTQTTFADKRCYIKELTANLAIDTEKGL